MKKNQQKWKSYEEAAVFLLNEMAEKFGLDRFEGEQIVEGKKSGTKYNIDAKGVKEDDNIFIIVECRRYTTSRQNQEKIGGLAYRINDTGAKGGILVSPFGMQKGAAKIAKAENIHNITLNEDCTRSEYILKFLNQVRLGLQDDGNGIDNVTVNRNP